MKYFGIWDCCYLHINLLEFGKMKKSSKSCSRSKRSKRSRSPSEEKTKLFKSRSKSKEREKKSEEKAPRKTRWQTQDSSLVAETDKSVVVAEEGPPLRIRDLVEDKEKLLEYLFLTVTGTALEELIPDYLKKNSLKELKSLCAEQIKDMSKECILNVISDQSEKVEENLKPVSSVEKISLNASSPSLSDSLSGDVLELCASASEIKSVIPEEREENQVPTPTDEATEDFRIPESDADLLELEMRARAIRSLLKARSQETSDSEAKDLSAD